jgi:cytidylate kinase
MPPRKQPISSELAKVVEKQLRNWEIDRAQNRQIPIDAEKPVADYVTISRAVGLPAYKVATLLHEKLGWPLFDRDILQVMAGNDEYRRRLYANMDGRDLGWLEGFVRGLALSRYERDDYFRRLTQTVLSIARQGRAIFVGRGTSFILPSHVGLKVRLTAPKDYCLESFARQKNLKPDQAARQAAQIEEDRAKFIRKHFYAEWDDPTMYDLVANMAHFSIEETVDLILSALCIRGVISNGPRRK